MARVIICDMCHAPVKEDNLHHMDVGLAKKVRHATVRDQADKELNWDLCPSCARHVVGYCKAYERGTR